MRQLPTVLLLCKFFAGKLHEMKEFGPRGRIPWCPLDPPMTLILELLEILVVSFWAKFYFFVLRNEEVGVCNMLHCQNKISSTTANSKTGFIVIHKLGNVGNFFLFKFEKNA